MAAEKRPASNSFGSSQLVKRQRSTVEMGSNGALIHAVCIAPLSDSRDPAVLNNRVEGRGGLIAVMS